MELMKAGVSIQHALYSREQILLIEQKAIAESGLPAFSLMQKAGAALLDACRPFLRSDGEVAIFTGPGNNAGDGYVLGHLLRQEGVRVNLISLAAPEKLQGSAAQARDQWLKGGEIKRFPHILSENTCLIVDALFGTGLVRPLEGDYFSAVAQINDYPAPVLAVDIPSGLCSTTGAILGTCVQASITATFVGHKIGLFSGHAADVRGELILDDLHCSPRVYEDVAPVAEKLDLTELAKALPPRPADCHKGHFGHALLIGGNSGMGGAIRMAGEACARVGAGLVSIATHPDHAALISSARPELMSHGISSSDEFSKLVEKASVIAIGPGLGQDDWSKNLWDMVVRNDMPLVLDADALNLLADNPRKKQNWILTPHPGEAARLLNCSTPEVQADRVSAVKELQERYGGTIILKGRGTLISSGGVIALYDGGNPGMASGGMGDVLTGILAGLLAQKLSSNTAARVAVLVHGHAANLAAEKNPRGLLASDLFGFLRQVVNPKV